MKFYETHYEDYCQAVKSANFHPELAVQTRHFPKTLATFENLILYGPSGVGKYSQLLHVLQPLSPSGLKYDKKMTVTTEKQSYTYRISDIHYEIDMSLLGCNAKTLWHEIFTQIVDIVSMKPDHDKVGVVVCKYFHSIHNELLEIFYSYMQQYPTTRGILGSAIQLKFVLLTEHLGFIPTNILDRCFVLRIPRPPRALVEKGLGITKAQFPREVMQRVLAAVGMENVTNLKELYSFGLVDRIEETETGGHEEGSGAVGGGGQRSLPKDNFNVICDDLIQMMDTRHSSTNMSLVAFRERLYDILVYNLDPCECVWYVFSYFVCEGRYGAAQLQTLLNKLALFFRHYGNNYRAIFHLEHIMLEMTAFSDEVGAGAGAVISCP